MEQDRERKATFLGIEKRLTWANAVEIGSIIVAATLLYAKFNGAAAAVEQLEPRVSALERVYERAAGASLAVEQRLANVERNGERNDQRMNQRLDRLEGKIDRLLLSAPPRNRTARTEDDE